MAGKAPGANLGSAAATGSVQQQQDRRGQQAASAQSLQHGDGGDDISPELPGANDFDAVTPGIHPSTYLSSSVADASARPSSRFPQSHQQHHGDHSDAPSYFSRADPAIDNADGLLRRTTTANARMATARRQSLSDIRAANPDLALSGNIISATFSIPHSFSYKKGGDWVSA